MTDIQFAYPCTLESDSAGRFLVMFPDIPEALTDGPTEITALSEAGDCLSTALLGYMLEGRPLPLPSRRKRDCYLVAPDATTRLKAAVYLVTRTHRVTAADLARALGVDHKEARRILDPTHRTKADRLEAALAVMGYATELTFYDAAKNRRILNAPVSVGSATISPAPTLRLRKREDRRSRNISGEHNQQNKTAPPPSQEVLRELTDYADKLAWKSPSLDVLGKNYEESFPVLTQIIQEQIKLSHERGKLILPNLQAFDNQTVAIFTDYGGEHKASRYLTYSTLLCAWDLCGLFLRRMKEIRTDHKLNDSEIAFKKFKRGELQRALPHYLDALDTVPGFLFTVAVDKSVATLFGADARETQMAVSAIFQTEKLGERKPKVNEKLLRISHILAFLVALFYKSGQKLFWKTDHDAISPSLEMHKKTLILLQRVLAMYVKEENMPKEIGAALPFDQPMIELMDLLSATDICAGSISDYLTRMRTVGTSNVRVKGGCDNVLRWLAHEGIGLKKMTVLIEKGERGAIRRGNLEFALERHSEDAVILPIVV